MKPLIFFAVVLAAGAQAREPDNLATLIGEMTILERVLGAALKSEPTPGTSGSARYPPGTQELLDYAGMHLQPWFQERVGTIESEYLVRQGILVTLQLRRKRSVRDLPNALLMMMARTGETSLPIPLVSLAPADLAALKVLVGELDETREKHGKLSEDWHVELRSRLTRGPDASENKESFNPEDSGPIGREISALHARDRELQADINAEIQRLRGILVEPAEETSENDIHGTLMQAVCDYAMLKSLPDDEHLTLKVGQEKAHPDGQRTGRQWTYYVLAKQDVVECRRGLIDAVQLRQRADVYSLPHD